MYGEDDFHINKLIKKNRREYDFTSLDTYIIEDRINCDTIYYIFRTSIIVFCKLDIQTFDCIDYFNRFKSYGICDIPIVTKT